MNKEALYRSGMARGILINITLSVGNEQISKQNRSTSYALGSHVFEAIPPQ